MVAHRQFSRLPKDVYPLVACVTAGGPPPRLQVGLFVGQARSVVLFPVCFLSLFVDRGIVQGSADPCWSQGKTDEALLLQAWASWYTPLCELFSTAGKYSDVLPSRLSRTSLSYSGRAAIRGQRYQKPFCTPRKRRYSMQWEPMSACSRGSSCLSGSFCPPPPQSMKARQMLVCTRKPESRCVAVSTTKHARTSYKRTPSSKQRARRWQNAQAFTTSSPRCAPIFASPRAPLVVRMQRMSASLPKSENCPCAALPLASHVAPGTMLAESRVCLQGWGQPTLFDPAWTRPTPREDA